MAIKTPYVTVRDQIVAVNGLTNPNANILAITKRGIAGNSTILPDLVPQNGYSKISLYEPFLLPAFGGGSDCLAFLAASGFRIGYGQTSTLNLPIANSVAVSSTNIYTITYLGIPSGFNILVGNAITATITQGSNTGTFISASISNSGNAILTLTSSSTFTTAALSIAYVNRSITTPDPAQTETCAMTLWTLFSELNAVGDQLTTTTTTFPKTYLLLMGQDDSGYSPNTTSITLGNPDYVTAVTSTTTVLSFDAIPANWGLLPDNQLGTSFVQQGSSSIQGVFYQKGLGNLIGASTSTAVCYIIINNTVGTFLDSAPVSILLDGSQTVDIMNKGNYCKYWLSYTEITSTNASITTQFKTIIDTQNNLNNLDINGGGLTFGFLGNVSQPLAQANSLQQLNDRYLVTSYFPQPTSISQPYLTANSPSQVSAFIIACCAMNAQPYNPMNNIISATLTAPLNAAYYIQKGIQATSEVVLQQGYTPLYINQFGQVATIRVVNSEINLPNTQIPDNEFFPMSTWQIITSYNEDCVALCKQPQYTNKRKTDSIKQSLLLGIIKIAQQYETNGMFSNVTALIPLFNVIDNPIAPDQWIVNSPIQIIPELSGIQINVSIYSFLTTFGSNA